MVEKVQDDSGNAFSPSLPDYKVGRKKVFPKIKRAKYRHLPTYPSNIDSASYFNELYSRAKWAKALLKELEFWQPEGVVLEVLQVNLARVKAELKRQAELDENG
ncbi:MAG: hypothetical protein UU72_C0037G0011 [candidate division WWE3 bacterium GW2011_GWB1_41_6]|uniref:Uncharacterized protein n=1 Tax=candidate division WWE3 bacterium GW2011_GWB1_41_6 TaxID=1619112 RepID=A0A0G0ZQT1_UNCKA|nr:MAG: hypothetical protein UU72_C0037G0011 [candidate division WWE3 bacterium GW2011_GWB1_41_6]